ncbi:MAG: hypothetical protein IPO43_05985 [Rhodoferax sp.]|nr:hypothetical protein [Rhodoferax sp.]
MAGADCPGRGKHVHAAAFTPLARYLGFTALPLSFFGLLTALLISYLVMVEGGKQWFYRRLMRS